MAKRNIDIRFLAHVTVCQTIEVDTDLTDEEVVNSLNGDDPKNRDVCTSFLDSGEVYLIAGTKIETIGEVKDVDYDDGAFFDFELNQE